MGKLDETKESLNTLRVGLSLLVGIMLVLSGGLINRFDLNKVDYIFWIGVILCLIFAISIFIILNKIAKKTKEIKDL